MKNNSINIDNIKIPKDKISVAMAVYEGEKYLSAQIDSILCQLRDYDELIISYDRSEDSTWDIINDYAARDSRISVFRNPSSGITSNFNNALKHCTGKYIYISDQDDIWISKKIATVQKYFKKTKADLIIHNGVYTDARLKPISRPFNEIYRIGDGKIKNIIMPRYSGCCMAFNRRMLKKIYPMPEIHGYDQWIATVCEFCGHIEYPNEVLILHRLHGSNATDLSKSRPLTTIIIMRSLLIYNLIKRLIFTRFLNHCFHHN